MAARLKTEYKQIEFDLNAVQLQTFIQLFQVNGFRTKTRIFDNGDSGDMEFLLIDQDNELPLVFHHLGSSFICEGSYSIKDRQLAHVMQKAVRDFQASALVHRVYPTYTIEYLYKAGKVVHIKELQQGHETQMIYEYHDPYIELQHIFSQQAVEVKIDQVKKEIDSLLDQRNLKQDQATSIDTKLTKLAHKLFILEG